MGRVVLRDGHPLLGRSKTWRGLAAAVVLADCAAVIIGLPWQAGAITGASAMAGDCLSSFVKQRMALEASSMSIGLDLTADGMAQILHATFNQHRPDSGIPPYESASRAFGII
jgi:hypothetical protein